jgi:hypothetical protein
MRGKRCRLDLEPQPAEHNDGQQDGGKEKDGFHRMFFLLDGWF